MLDAMNSTTENTTYQRPKIMIVEDDPDIAELLQNHLEFSLNADLQTANSAEQALQLDAEKPAEVIVVDYLLPDSDGLDLITPLNARQKRPIILITGHPTLGRAIEAMRLGAVDMFVKPFDLDVVTAKIAQAIEQHRHEERRIQRLIRVRELSKKVIQERRSLRRKLDVLCKDIVVSYRDMAEKISKYGKPGNTNLNN
jgi:DNA-binding NtrC family response regulator